MDEEEFLIFMQKINKKVEIEEIFKRFLYFPTSLLFLLNLIIIIIIYLFNFFNYYYY